MPLNLLYTMVQKSQKWPKTQIKGGGGPALNCNPAPTQHLKLNPQNYFFIKLESYSDFRGVIFQPIVVFPNLCLVCMCVC